MPILKSYRHERRALEIPNFRREDLGTVVRYSPNCPDADGIICFADLPVEQLDAEIQRQIAYFSTIGIGFEWKVYGSDEPKCLRDKLVGAGFKQGDPEILMVYELARLQLAVRPLQQAIAVRHVESIEALEQIVEFQERIWRTTFAWLLAQLRSAWSQCTFFAAYDRQRLVGTGWIEYPEGSQFAELHGGAVLPDYRGRGLYSRLFEARMADALARGYKWVTVDAAPMSQPILEAKGFERLDTTYPMTWVNV